MASIRHSPRHLVALAFATACTVAGESGFQRYADRVAESGDSAVLAVAHYRQFDSTASLAWNGEVAARLERQATTFAGILKPDTAATAHRLMLDGLDTLVVALRTLDRRNTQCRETPSVACADERDYGRILASLRRGDSLYRAGRRQLEEILDAAGASLPPLPATDSRR